MILQVTPEIPASTYYAGISVWARVGQSVVTPATPDIVSFDLQIQQSVVSDLQIQQSVVFDLNTEQTVEFSLER